MIVDIRTSEKTALFIGRGREFMEKLDLYGGEFNKTYIISPEVVNGNFDIIADRFDRYTDIISKIAPFFTFVSTEIHDLDTEIVSFARKYSKIVYSPDRNDLSDINLCALLFYGPIRIAVSTGGKSPAMTVMVKKRLNAYIKKYSIITESDERIVEAIARKRGKIIDSIVDKRKRRTFMYRIAADRGLAQSEDKLDDGIEEVINSEVMKN